MVPGILCLCLMSLLIYRLPDRRRRRLGKFFNVSEVKKQLKTSVLLHRVLISVPLLIFRSFLAQPRFFYLLSPRTHLSQRCTKRSRDRWFIWCWWALNRDFMMKKPLVDNGVRTLDQLTEQHHDQLSTHPYRFFSLLPYSLRLGLSLGASALVDLEGVADSQLLPRKEHSQGLYI